MLVASFACISTFIREREIAISKSKHVLNFLNAKLSNFIQGLLVYQIFKIVQMDPNIF